MNYEQERNKVIRRYVSGIYHLNWIKLDGNSDPKHDDMVCKICVKVKHNKDYGDFLARPEIKLIKVTCPCGESRIFGHTELFVYMNFLREHNEVHGDVKVEHFTYYPDVMTWIIEPFKTVIFETLKSETKDHADNKNYPSEFKIVSIDVKDSIEGLVL